MGLKVIELLVHVFG